MVSDATYTSTIKDAQGTQQSSLKLADDFSQFLTLLTTQLQNQDPMNPMDSTEFTNQLVQFSQVEQSINTNQKLDTMVNLQLASISSVALGFVGMDVMYSSADMHYDGTNSININYGLSEAAASAKMNVYDESGELVYTSDAPKAAGRNELVWDGTHKGGGKVDPGTYTVKIEATNNEGTPIETTTVVSGRVKGIETQDGIVYLLVGERAVPMGTVINAKLPATPAAPAPEDTPDET